jgi:hypothetical protein
MGAVAPHHMSRGTLRGSMEWQRQNDSCRRLAYTRPSRCNTPNLYEVLCKPLHKIEPTLPNSQTRPPGPAHAVRVNVKTAAMKIAFLAVMVPSIYVLRFLPGRMPARTFLAFSISRAVQSRTFTPPTFCNGGASTVLADTCLWSVRIVTPSFLAASRVERSPFTNIPISHLPLHNALHI